MQCASMIDTEIKTLDEWDTRKVANKNLALALAWASLKLINATQNHKITSFSYLFVLQLVSPYYKP